MIPALARVVRTVGYVAAGVLALGVLLVVVDANEDNGLVHAALEVGRWLADPFRRIIELDDNELQIAINWGIAAAAYLALSAFVAYVLVAAARAAGRREGTSG